MKKNQGSKINFSVLFYALCSLLLVVSVAYASGGGEEAAHHTPLWKEYLWKIINFGVLFFVLFKFGKKPLQDFLKTRTELIEKTLKEAQEAKTLAQKALAEVEERLKVKDKELEEILSSARQSGESEKSRLIEEGNKMKAKILEQAKTNIDYELREAKAAIKAEAVEIAMELAEKKIRDKIGKSEQDMLLEESLMKIEGKK
ncbi:MAG: ATP synthase F0 subunit B [Nitrospirae bacterium]|nr:ATP synthase F0 subunit B [Nitrospirota bacterium]